MNNSLGAICIYGLILSGIFAVVIMAAPEQSRHTGNAFIDKASSTSVLEKLANAFD